MIPRFRIRTLSTAAVLTLLFVGCADNPTDTNNNGGAKPTGTIYMNADIHGKIYAIDLQTGTATNLFAGADPDRTPEGTFIVRTFRGLEEISADGVSSRLIVESKIFEPYEETYDDDFRNPQVSPDGKYIAYEGQFGYRYDFYVVDRQTGELLLSYYDPAVGAGMVRPTWTPDNRIVVAGTHNNPGLYITDNAWENLTRFDPTLNNPDQPAVSPDGGKVAFVMNDHIYTINIDGTGLKQITTSSGKESWPTWSPDGQRIAGYGDNSILFYPLSASGYYNIRSLGTSIDNYMTFTSTRDGQFDWR